jgi:uncharacterized membrane protein
MVYLPAAPIPMSGGLLLIAEHAIIPVPEMKVDDLLRIYFSLGALASDSMPSTLKESGNKPVARIAPPAAAPSPGKLTMPRELA